MLRQQDPIGLRWYRRLHHDFWFYRGWWHTVYFFGYLFSFGHWHPAKRFSPIPELPSDILINILLTDMPVQREDEPEDEAAIISVLNKAARMARTSKSSYQIVQPVLDAYRERALLGYVVKGNEKKAEAILAQAPDLLFKHPKQPVMDYSLRRILQSPWEAAWGADDERMLLMMQGLFPRIAEGHQIALKQYRDQYPNNTDSVKQTTYAAGFFKPIVDALVTNDVDMIRVTLEDFKQALGKTRQSVIRKGKHFDMDLIRAAAKIQQALRSNDSDMFREAMFGYMSQHYLPACYAQALCHDLDKKNKDTRTLRLSATANFYPVHQRGAFDLTGFETYGYIKSSFEELSYWKKKVMEDIVFRLQRAETNGEWITPNIELNLLWILRAYKLSH